MYPFPSNSVILDPGPKSSRVQQSTSGSGSGSCLLHSSSSEVTATTKPYHLMSTLSYLFERSVIHLTLGLFWKFIAVEAATNFIHRCDDNTNARSAQFCYCTVSFIQHPQRIRDRCKNHNQSGSYCYQWIA